jgi:hypothetical protein
MVRPADKVIYCVYQRYQYTRITPKNRKARDSGRAKNALGRCASPVQGHLGEPMGLKYSYQCASGRGRGPSSGVAGLVLHEVLNQVARGRMSWVFKHRELEDC